MLVRRKTENAKPPTRLFMNFTRESVAVSVRMTWAKRLTRGVASRRVLRYNSVAYAEFEPEANFL